MKVPFYLGFFAVWICVSYAQDSTVQKDPVPASLTPPKLELSQPALVIKSKKTTSLEQMLAAVREKPGKSQDPLPLERDWIGEVREVNGEFTRLRLEMGQIRKGKIYLISIDPAGEMEVESPLLVEKIPGDDEIKKCRTLESLEAFFGKGHKGFEEWHGPNGTLGSKLWVCVAQNGRGGLDYIRVIADIFYAEEEVAHLSEVNVNEISRGSLRQSNPASEIEKMIYSSTKDELFLRIE